MWQIFWLIPGLQSVNNTSTEQTASFIAGVYSAKIAGKEARRELTQKTQLNTDQKTAQTTNREKISGKILVNDSKNKFEV